MTFLILILLCVHLANSTIFHNSIISSKANGLESTNIPLSQNITNKEIDDIHTNNEIESAERKTEFIIDAYPAPGNPFHIAIPVHSMTDARNFYGGILGLIEGRRCDDKWQDYSMYGHQIVCHYVGDSYKCADYYNPVDGDEVPVAHFGICLLEEEFHQLASKLKANGIKFIIEPHLRFQGQPGEQWTMFFKDPSSNNLEFKALKNPQYLFAKYNVIDNKK